MKQIDCRRVGVLVAAAVFSIFVWACSDGGGGGGGNTDLESSSQTPLPTVAGRIYGTVVDFSSMSPIQGANVTLYLDNTQTKTAASDAQGNFTVTEVPGGEFKLKVEKDGFANYEEWVELNNSESSIAAGMNGKVKLSLGCNLSVYVVGDSAPVSGATVYAMPIQIPMVYSATFPSFLLQVPEQSATTDATGLATLNGLAQSTPYTVLVPAKDTNNDGVYDYETTSYSTSAASGYRCIAAAGTVTLALNKAGNADEIRVVAGTYVKYDSPSFTDTPYSSVASGEAIVLFFNMPVNAAASGAQQITYFDVYSNPTTPPASSTYNKSVNVPFTSAWSAGNTMLTITPGPALSQLYAYTINGSVEATIDGLPRVAAFGSLAAGFPGMYGGGSRPMVSKWYVVKSDAWTLDAVRADNYNGKSDGTSLASTVYLQFPDAVKGRYYVQSKTTEGTTQQMTTRQEYDLGGGQIVADWRYTASAPCRDAGLATCTPNGEIKYRVGTQVSLKDNMPSAANNITVYIDAHDMKGNTYQGLKTLPIY